MDKKKKAGRLEDVESLAGMALPDFVLRSATSLSKSLIENNRGPTQKEIQSLRKRLAEAFQRVSLQLAEFPDEQTEAMKCLEIANRSISSGKEISQSDFLKSEENLIRALVILNRKIRSTQVIKRMVGVVVVVSIIYFGIIAYLQYKVYLDAEFNLLGTPGLVLAWGCLGGVTTILFRHRSMMEKIWPFDFRWLWVAIRPLLGMIMGAFIYQAIISGLLLAVGATPPQGPPQKPLLWALAFIGGFSDRLWEILINSVLSSYSQENKSDDA